MNQDRVSFTIRAPRADYDALQRQYYARLPEHRLSFNAYILESLAAGMYATNTRLSDISESDRIADLLVAMDVYAR